MMMKGKVGPCCFMYKYQHMSFRSEDQSVANDEEADADTNQTMTMDEEAEAEEGTSISSPTSSFSRS